MKCDCKKILCPYYFRVVFTAHVIIKLTTPCRAYLLSLKTKPAKQRLQAKPFLSAEPESLLQIYKQTTVHEQLSTCDVAAQFLAGEEDCGAGEVGWDASATERDATLHI